VRKPRQSSVGLRSPKSYRGVGPFSLRGRGEGVAAVLGSRPFDVWLLHIILSSAVRVFASTVGSFT
jgi:hypothetical protein